MKFKLILIGIVTLGIGAVIYIVYSNWDKIVAWFNKAGDSVMEVITAPVEAIESAGETWSDMIASKIENSKKSMDSVAENIGQKVNAVVSTTVKVVNSSSKTSNSVKKSVKSAVKTITKKAKKVVKLKW